MAESNHESIINICLRVWGDNLIPSSVTSLLNVNPTQSFKKGAVKGVSRGKEIAAKSGSWMLKTEEQVNSPSLEVHIEYVLGLLRGKGDDLLSLDGVDGAGISFILGVIDGADSIDFNLKPEVTREIGELNLELSFSII